RRYRRPRPAPGRHGVLPRRPRRLRPDRRHVPRPGARAGEGAGHRGGREHHGRAPGDPHVGRPRHRVRHRGQGRRGPPQHGRGAAPGRRAGVAPRGLRAGLGAMRSRGSQQRRRDEIVRLATASGPASVEELARAFGVTASTIRRDLAALTAEGRLARTYGGAMPVTAHPEPPLRERTGEAFAAKRAIARAAVAEVGPGETVLLDAGSTVGALARELRSVPGLTVITVGLTALQELSDPAEIDAQGITVHCLGGTLRPLSQGFVGPLAEAALERLTFDR